MSEEPYRYFGGFGHDDNLWCFGDTIYTITRLYQQTRPNLEYQLKISHNVKNGAELAQIDCRNIIAYYKEVIPVFEGMKPIFVEWEYIEQKYKNIELIESENKTLQNGHIILYNPEHIIEARMLDVFGGGY